ncbi:metal ABC transporter permease [Sporosalibacterium faouarense]|uniref:metal ABC transporter permease n=1 Tax=Sporosalibacterium faouarense TaxID=516123 RepID=UPI00141CCC20|nr:metal ABC transporter permease [Sporosalibacterium faouarense]MTI48288.1 metal ABC transporter permease [Bacillota bacterium]
MIEAIFKYTYLQNAFLSAVLASIACGIIGTIIIEKKLVMLSGGIAHTSFGGIGLGYYIGIEPIYGAFVFAIISALGIAQVSKKIHTYSDALIGMFWSLGMALGILFIAITPGYPPDMTSYLFGDILTVSSSSIIMMSMIDLIIVIVIFSLYNYWKAYFFDEEFSKVIGIPTEILEKILFIMIALTIVVLIKLVGIILVIALLTIPPSIAKLLSYNLMNIMLISIIVGVVLCILGLYLSYRFDIASGATIILTSGATYFISAFIKSQFKTKNGN